MVYYTGISRSAYSNLDAAIDMAGQSLERYMLAIHEMKAAFDKAWELIVAGEALSKTAEGVIDKRKLVDSTFDQAVAAKGVWDQGLSTVMPAYRKFKLLSTK